MKGKKERESYFTAKTQRAQSFDCPCKKGLSWRSLRLSGEIVV
jgi:hypothetical protein